MFRVFWSSRLFADLSLPEDFLLSMLYQVKSSKLDAQKTDVITYPEKLGNFYRNFKCLANSEPIKVIRKVENTKKAGAVW